MDPMWLRRFHSRLFKDSDGQGQDSTPAGDGQDPSKNAEDKPADKGEGQGQGEHEDIEDVAGRDGKPDDEKVRKLVENQRRLNKKDRESKAEIERLRAENEAFKAAEEKRKREAMSAEEKLKADKDAAEAERDRLRAEKADGEVTIELVRAGVDELVMPEVREAVKRIQKDKPAAKVSEILADMRARKPALFVSSKNSKGISGGPSSSGEPTSGQAKDLRDAAKKAPSISERLALQRAARRAEAEAK